MTLFFVILGVYLAAVNFYGVLLMHFQKKNYDEEAEKRISDGRIFLTAFLGGTLGIYLYMLIGKFRLHSLALVVLLPLVFVLNAYLVYLAVTGGMNYIGTVV